MWLATRENEIENQVVKVSVIMYEFYSKGVAFKAVINASKIYFKLKYQENILTHEVQKILLNFSKLLPWKRVVENVNEMVLDTKMNQSNNVRSICGYSQFIRDVIWLKWIYGIQALSEMLFSIIFPSQIKDKV